MERKFSNTSVFPATLEHLTMFIAHCFDKNLASSTVLTCISALSFLLKLGGIFRFDATFHCYKNFTEILQPQKSKRFPSATYTIHLKGIN